MARPPRSGRPFLKLSDFPRFWGKVEFGPSDEFPYRCWRWAATLKANGYGMFLLGGRKNPKAWHVHRLAYELLRGPIPEGLTIDHLCRNRACVNPLHMEPVSNRENILRGMSPSAKQARQTVCRRAGHPLVLRGNGKRFCAECHREDRRRWYRKRRPPERLPKPCEFCGTIFQPSAKIQRFCSVQCNGRDFRHRHPGYKNEYLREYRTRQKAVQ